MLRSIVFLISMILLYPLLPEFERGLMQSSGVFGGFAYASATETPQALFGVMLPSALRTPAEDQILLDTLQRDVCMYMWEASFPESGMVRERNDGGNLGAVGGTGFGVAALTAAVSRGWIPRTAAVERLLKLTLFLRDKTARKALHGAFPHWINGHTGETVPFGKDDDGVDIVETAFLMEGLLIARAYFDGSDKEESRLRAVITELWESVEWDCFADSDALYWHWSPSNGFAVNMKIAGFNEGLVAYVLALSSPTHPIKPQTLRGWYSPEDYRIRDYYGYRVHGAIIYTGPLFLTHYSFIGLDPRRLADTHVPMGYMERNIAQTLVNRAYCLYVADPGQHFSEGMWGLTSSETPKGYLYSSPMYESATVAPTAAISSVVYTPEYAMRVLWNLRVHHVDFWGPFGPYDAINIRDIWKSKVYLAIDQLPMACMIENYRSGLLWNLFASNKEIFSGLKKGGFFEPEPKNGFAYMTPAFEGLPKEASLGGNLSEKIPRAVCDLRRHPDAGRYSVAFASENNAVAVFLLRNAHGEELDRGTVTVERGLHEYRLGAHLVPDGEILTLTLTLIPTSGEAKKKPKKVEPVSFELSVRLN